MLFFPDTPHQNKARRRIPREPFRLHWREKVPYRCGITVLGASRLRLLERWHVYLGRLLKRMDTSGWVHMGIARKALRKFAPSHLAANQSLRERWEDRLLARFVAQPHVRSYGQWLYLPFYAEANGNAEHARKRARHFRRYAAARKARQRALRGMGPKRAVLQNLARRVPCDAEFQHVTLKNRNFLTALPSPGTSRVTSESGMSGGEMFLGKACRWRSAMDHRNKGAASAAGRQIKNLLEDESLEAQLKRLQATYGAMCAKRAEEADRAQQIADQQKAVRCEEQRKRAEAQRLADEQAERERIRAIEESKRYTEEIENAPAQEDTSDEMPAYQKRLLAEPPASKRQIARILEKTIGTREDLREKLPAVLERLRALRSYSLPYSRWEGIAAEIAVMRGHSKYPIRNLVAYVLWAARKIQKEDGYDRQQKRYTRYAKSTESRLIH